MKHPFMFLVDLFDVHGTLYHYAHLYKQVPYTWLIMLVLIALGLIAARNPQLVPTKGQNVLELLVSGLEDFMVDIVGEEGRWFLPLAATIFIFIFVSNLSGLIPGFFPPTASINTNLGCAIVVFIFTHYLGIRHHGAHYVKHFMGPVWWMVPLIMPIEIIGHLARILSLTFRLFGNMAGHELVLMILFMLAGLYFAPLPIMALGIFVAFVQAFVFFLLSIIYFSGSIEHAH
jgi:F-type H+-transporting ATPase subunit a